MKVAVIGAGTMGSGIAQVFAQCDKVVVPEIVDASKDLNPGDVVLLENLRFRPEEEEIYNKLVEEGDKNE